MKQVKMYKGETEIAVLLDTVERMESIGWSKKKPPRVKKEKPKEDSAE